MLFLPGGKAWCHLSLEIYNLVVGGLKKQCVDLYHHFYDISVQEFRNSQTESAMLKQLEKIRCSVENF